MNEKARDIVLLVIAAGILVAIFLPSPDAPRDDESPAESDGLAGQHPLPADEEPNGLGHRTESAAPAVGIPHRLLPLVAGSSWVYRVDGPKDLVPSDTWTMKLTELPREEDPGTLEVGFGDRPMTKTHIWSDQGTLRLDGLPLTEPLKYLGNRPTGVTGYFIPQAGAIGRGAVWRQELAREVVHRFRDSRGKPQERPAKAMQRDRAEVEDEEEVTTPAGRYQAFRVYWLSRIEIKVKKRLILDRLTDEPYRKEIMWLTPGIGVVRRRIEYPGVRAGRISFDLLHYTRPQSPAAVKGDADAARHRDNSVTDRSRLAPH